jgi:biopolymer transport protein ExbD
MAKKLATKIIPLVALVLGLACIFWVAYLVVAQEQIPVALPV